MSLYNQIILVFLYLCLSFVMILSIYSNIKKNHMITISSFFRIYMLLVYGLTPIISIISINDFNDYFFTFDVKYYYWLFIITVIFYFIYLISCNIKTMKKSTCNHEINIESDRFFFTTLLISLIGIISIIMWTKVFGKPWDIIKYANAIRSGYSPVYNPYTFLKPFCYFIIIAFYNNFIIIRKTRFKILNIIDLMVNLFLSIIFLLANDSRMSILVFFLTIILFFKNKSLKLNAKTIISYFLISCLVILLLGKLDNITYFIRNGQSRDIEASSNISEIINEEFTYTYRNGVNVLYLYDNDLLPEPHELQDLKNILYSFVPVRFKTNLIDLGTLNTSYYHNISGALPTDIITASIFKFHILGILIMPIIIRIIISVIEGFFYKFKSDYIFLIYNHVGCNICLRLVAYYDLSNNLFSSFYIIVTTIIIYLLCSKKINKSNLIEN